MRCAPPGNKPSRGELQNCQSHLEAELAALRGVQVVVALGKIAFDAYWRLVRQRGVSPRARPAFAHGAVYAPLHAPVVIASYHPSRQNTNTGKLTPPMLVSVFRKARRLIAS